MYEVTTLRNILKYVRAQSHWRSGIVLNQLSTLLKTRKNLAKVAAYHRAIVAMQWIYHRQSLCKSSVPIDTYVLFSQKECSWNNIGHKVYRRKWKETGRKKCLNDTSSLKFGPYIYHPGELVEERFWRGTTDQTGFWWHRGYIHRLICVGYIHHRSKDATVDVHLTARIHGWFATRPVFVVMLWLSRL